jgi:hypothetical protein
MIYVAEANHFSFMKKKVVTKNTSWLKVLNILVVQKLLENLWRITAKSHRLWCFSFNYFGKNSEKLR